MEQAKVLRVGLQELNSGFNKIIIPHASKIIDAFYAQTGDGWIRLVYEYCPSNKKDVEKNFYVGEISNPNNPDVPFPIGKHIGTAVATTQGDAYLVYEV